MKVLARVFFIVVSGLAVLLCVASRLEAQAGQSLRTNKATAEQLADVEDDSANLKMVVPGSPEARYVAKLRAQDKASGRLPDVNLDGMAVLRTAVPAVPQYKGSHLQVDERAKGDMRTFQQKFANAFLQHDPQPQLRSTHFSWIPLSPSLRRIGWYGAIVDAEKQPDESVIVTIKIQPWLYANTRASLITDFVREKYLVANGQFTLIGSDAADATNHQHVFTMAKSQ